MSKILTIRRNQAFVLTPVSSILTPAKRLCVLVSDHFELVLQYRQLIRKSLQQASAAVLTQTWTLCDRAYVGSGHYSENSFV